MSIIIAGDFHGKFGPVNTLIAKYKPSIILQCGDFGWWPRFHGQEYKIGYMKTAIWNQYSLNNKDTKIFWCPGNHEDWESLNGITKNNNEVMPNVFYLERGHIIELPDHRKILFIGGALSIDRDNRIERSPYFGWFHEETISQIDIETLPDENIDIIISHTAPNEFIIKNGNLNYPHDPSRDALSYVLKKYQPKLWYFGHMHKFQTGKFNDCEWTCLSAVGFPDRWWVPLKEI
jgi:Icc-related predicted phosphoesterase